MVNAPSDIEAPERRERPRVSAEHAPALGTSQLHPFGDLVALQHLSARLARQLKGVFDGVVRKSVRAFAEPVVVQRYADYRAERGDSLAAWQPMAIAPGRHRAMLVFDGGFVLEMLDCFFGGDGEVPSPMPTEFTPAAEALVARVANAFAVPLAAAWEPLAPLSFATAATPNLAAIPDLGGDTAIVITRFGIAVDDAAPTFVDLLYPVAALKPHGSALSTKVHGDEQQVEPEWRSGLTRAVMGVRLPVRSVLAEPIVSLGRLMELKVGDILPIEFTAEVPVMVAARRLGTGQVGTANGYAAVRLTAIEPLTEEDFQ